MVVVSHVIAESRTHTGIGDQRVSNADPSRMVERTQRDLPVHGSEDAADLGEPRRLRNGNLTLAKTNRKICVDGQLVADRRIDIETIDPWFACGTRGLDAGRATARHDRSGHWRSTRIARESWT